MLTVLFLVSLAAFICILLSAINRVPLWIGCLLLAIADLLRHIPLGK